MHAVDPADALYLPATHCEHIPTSGPLDPLLHVHSLRAWLPNDDDDREGQLEHVLDVVAPEVVEYVPPVQRAQDAELCNFFREGSYEETWHTIFLSFSEKRAKRIVETSATPGNPTGWEYSKG